MTPMLQAKTISQPLTTETPFTQGKYRVLVLVFDDYEILDLHGRV